MKFAYKFSNLLGSVYRKGNVIFTPSGNSIISPVGNRVTVFDLKNNKSETLPLTCRMNITCIALSPDGYTFIVVDEEGEAMLCSLLSKSVLHTYHFHNSIRQIKFSPDGKKFAVTRENMLMVFHSPGRKREFNPFVLYRTFYGAFDETTCIDWTTDSRAFLAGSKDMNTRVYGIERYENLIIYSIGGHGSMIVGAYFEQDSLDLFSVAQNGRVNVWGCDTELSKLIPYQRKETAPVRKKKTDADEEEEEEEEEEQKGQEVRFSKEEENKMVNKIQYKKKGGYSFRDEKLEFSESNQVSSTAYHKSTRILVTGFKNGSFFLHEMPEFNMIHSLSISDQCISTVCFNNTGDWIGLACSGLGQLLVWEWQSETYVLKQQGHFNNMECMAYSPDGQYLATGGDDGKVKVWSTSSGFCYVTFSEHLGGITGVTFNQRGQVVLSSSLDGSVRAFDLKRYRNFRTFTSPRPAQFSCLAVDHSGDVVCAGALDSFEIFVWSMQTGRLLEVFAGHEGPISSLSFSPTRAILASGSWDKTVKLWDVFENKGARETLSILSDVLCVSFRPDGEELAVAALNAEISFWNVQSASQTGSIEGRHDVGYSRKIDDKITAKKSSFGKAFNTICYSADGKCILAAGKTKNVCIYSVADQILMKKFEIMCNMSFDGMEEYLDKRKMTEFGSLSLVDQSEGKDISLPGVRQGDMSARHWKPQVRVSCIQFSPTGRAWAATTTEGLLIYSLDSSLVFDPFELEMDITPASVKKTLANKEYSTALMLSFRLNEQFLIQEVLENIPPTDMDVVCDNLPDTYVDKLLSYVATQIEKSAHLEFYLMWSQKLLMRHGPKIKARSQQLLGILRNLQKNVTRKVEDLGKICDHNKYTIEYIIALSRCKRKCPSVDLDENETGERPLEGESQTDSDEVESDMEGLEGAKVLMPVTESDSEYEMDFYVK